MMMAALNRLGPIVDYDNRPRDRHRDHLRNIDHLRRRRIRIALDKSGRLVVDNRMRDHGIAVVANVGLSGRCS